MTETYPTPSLEKLGNLQSILTEIYNVSECLHLMSEASTPASQDFAAWLENSLARVCDRIDLIDLKLKNDEAFEPRIPTYEHA